MSSSGEPLDDRPERKPERKEVFISHRSTSPYQELSDKLTAKLHDRNISYFFDVENLHTGEAFAARIIENIQKSRLVVVLFPKEMSPWLHFEAACAFFDHKLFPIAVDDGKVPPPYDRIQHETVKTASIDNAALEKVASEIERRVRGRGHATKIYRWINRLFFQGFNIIFAVLFALFVLHLAPTDQINHLHVVAGAVMLGGQFFLSIGFATIAASPSFQERQFGFNTVEWLLIVWGALALIQPLLGLWLAFLRWGGLAEFPHWIFYALILYLLGLLFTGAGYLCAKEARELDNSPAAPQSIASRDLLANILFLAGFIVMVAVINLMLVSVRPKTF
jgi:hypothetical protein